MARPKKGTLYNLVFPMVDKTDFASIESGITASDFNSAATKKFFGVNHGASTAATSGTISKATLLTHSGIFQQTLNTTETNYDRVIAVFQHPSCADQIIAIDFDDYDDSDIMSRLSDIGSDLLSYLTGISGMVSDVDSQLLLNASVISDIQSALDSQFTYISNALSDIQSDLTSQIGAIAVTITASDISDIASAVKVILASDMSDILSATQQTNSRVLVVQSMVSDVDSQLTVTHSLLSDVDSQVNLLATSNYLSQVHSDLASQIGGLTVSVTASDMSDIASRVWATTEGTRVDSRILVLQSLVSDVDSHVNLLATSNYLSQVHSDLASQIGGLTVTVTASDMSDIASRVWATTEGARVDSRILVIQSLVSDIDSQLLLNASMISDIDSALTLHDANISAAISDAHSDLASQIGGLTVTVTDSDMSDIASRVWATVEGTRVDSRILVIQSLVSDVDSQVNLLATSDYLSQVHSDLASQIGAIAVTVTSSDISDIASAVKVILASDMSDILSAAQQTNSRALVIQSMVSDVDSALTLHDTTINAAVSDAHSDLASQIAGITATVTASDISDIASAVKVILASDMSDILSAAQQTNSRALVIQSMISDVDSALTLHDANISAAISDAHSDLASQIGGLTVNVTASDMSDIASRVWAEAIGARVDSRIALIQSNVSDVESAVDLLATSNYLSQVHSDIASRIVAVPTAGAIADAVADEVLTAGTHNVANSLGRRIRAMHEYGGYEGGAVWIDTVNGTAGTEDYENGTVSFPVDSIADANTLATSLGLHRFDIAPGSTITFTAAQTAQIFQANGATIALGGQNIANTNIYNATVSGICTGSGFELVDCHLGAISTEDGYYRNCDLSGTITLTAAGNYTFARCHSSVVDPSAAVIDFGAAVGNVAVLLRDYSGSIEIQNYNVTGTDTFAVDGDGLLTINANCTGGTIYVRGNFDITDNSGGAVTILYDDNTNNTALILADTNELQTNQGNWVTATGFATSNYLSQVHSDIYSAVTQTNSRVALVQSNVSDIESQVDLLPTSNYLSQVHSDLASRIGGVTATVSASDISDIASAVWANATRTLTQSAASVTAAVSGSTITVYRGTTWSISLTGLGDISTYDTIYLSAKASLNDSEDNAYLRVKNAASGLLRINQAAPTAATNGTITIDDAASGNITITVNEAETTGVPIISGLTYDIKGVDNDGQVDLISIGSKLFTISGDVTRAIT